LKIAWPGSRCLLCLWPVKQIDIYNEPRLRCHILCKNLAISSLLINSNPLFGQLHLMCCLSLPKRRGSIIGIFLPFFLLILYLQQTFYTFQIQFSLTVGFGCKNSDINRIAAIQRHADLNKISDRYLENYVPFHK
jgi:hypothetical protein